MRLTRVVDLSGEIYEGMPVYPGHQRTAIFWNKTHEEHQQRFGITGHSGCSMGILVSDHGPTHTDAFNHIDPRGAESIDQLPLDRFITPAVCVDVSHIEVPELITQKVIEDGLKRHGLTAERGWTLLLYTGHYNRNYGNAKWLYEYTGLSHDAALWCAEKGIQNVGVDTPSLDSSMEMKNQKYPAHGVCRDYKLLNTENMANLDQVVGQQFWYAGIPLKIRGGTGSPVRSAAMFFE